MLCRIVFVLVLSPAPCVCQYFRAPYLRHIIEYPSQPIVMAQDKLCKGLKADKIEFL